MSGFEDGVGARLVLVHSVARAEQPPEGTTARPARLTLLPAPAPAQSPSGQGPEVGPENGPERTEQVELARWAGSTHVKAASWRVLWFLIEAEPRARRRGPSAVQLQISLALTRPQVRAALRVLTRVGLVRLRDGGFELTSERRPHRRRPSR